MNIYTDLIKNKRFDCLIQPEFLKRSQEYRVLATLRYLFPQQYTTMIKGESPDLQDSENGIGIEVVSAVRENDMKATRAFSKLCRASDNRDVEKQKRRIVSSGYSLDMIPKEKLVISTTGTSNGERSFLQESIRKKKAKLQQYRENFKMLGLAIVFPEIPTSEAECRLVDWTREVFCEDDNLFDFVYLLSHRFCIYYDVRADCFQKQVISNEETYLLRTIARMTAEEELSLENQEWK